MNDQELMLLAGKLLQSGAAAARIEKVTHQHDQAWMGKESRERAYRRQQMSFAVAGEFGEKVKEAENLLAPSTHRQGPAQGGGNGGAANPAEIFETDVAKSSGDPFAVADLRRCPLRLRPLVVPNPET